MKNAAKRFLLMAPLLGLFTTSCDDNLDDPKGKGPFCVYAGVRYKPGESWKAQDGCNSCACGLNKLEVLCSKDQVCGDGGASDVSRAGDATADRLPSSDVTPASDAPVDKAQDVASADIPVSDANPIDAASDGPVSDGRLASERD